MSYILRYGKMGEKTCPIIAEEAGLDVFKAGDKLPNDAEYLFRWGTTVNVGGDVKVVNKIKAINTSADKATFRKTLADNGLAPRTHVDIKGFRNDEFWPALVRPAEHQRSQDMHLCNNPWDVMEALDKVGREFYISEFIQKAREFRVMVVSGRVVWVIEKHPKNKDDVSWGCVTEGTFDYVGWEDWPIALVSNALRAFSLSTLDFGAIDIIMDAEGNAYSLEINTAPFLTPYYAKTIGKAFKYIIKNGRDHFPLREVADWKDAIHPAISDKART